MWVMVSYLYWWQQQRLANSPHFDCPEKDAELFKWGAELYERMEASKSDGYLTVDRGMYARVFTNFFFVSHWFSKHISHHKEIALTKCTNRLINKCLSKEYGFFAVSLQRPSRIYITLRGEQFVSIPVLGLLLEEAIYLKPFGTALVTALLFWLSPHVWHLVTVAKW